MLDWHVQMVCRMVQSEVEMICENSLSLNNVLFASMQAKPLGPLKYT
jgi:hypothetical protein